MIKKYKDILIAATIAIVALLVGAVGVAYANPIYTATTVQTATATTSPAYIGVGVATSTLTYDSYATTNKFLPTKVALAMQYVGSSTSSVLGIAVEYSNDGIDWYRSTVVDPNSLGTTTQGTNLNTVNSYNWKYSSTEIIGNATAASATTTRLIVLPVPTRYVRVVESMTGAAGAVWNQFIPTKELQ